MPIPRGRKEPPPVGFTGEAGSDTTAEQIAFFAKTAGAGGVALRLPRGVIGIDVDSYTSGTVAKQGAQTFLRSLAQWGELPPTWTSTARGPGPSRIYFFRVPEQRYQTTINPDIEIIQRHHRYAIVWPSLHPNGQTYTWYGPDGQPCGPPGREDLPWLPERWVAGLLEGATVAGPPAAPRAAGEALLAILHADEREVCSAMLDGLDAAVRELEAPDVGTRHDAIARRIHRIVHLGAFGHAGAGKVLAAFANKWEALTPGESREGELERMILGSAQKAVTETRGVAPTVDPCTILGGPLWAGAPVVPVAPVPVDHTPAPGAPVVPAAPALPVMPGEPSWGQLIGTEPFRPFGMSDHELADAMLIRVRAAARRTDDKSRWLLAGIERWEEVPDLSRRIVKECADVMPAGDPAPVLKGEEPTDAQRDAIRRKRLLTNSGAAAVASSIRGATDGGRHPLSVKRTELDQDPHVLWAGGRAWDLRAPVPTVAAIDPATPHLKAAGIWPDPNVPTPRWDAFLASVWPDAAVRAWCLRVLSIGLTGFPDEALPVLYGEGGTGKTSVTHLISELLGNYAVTPDAAVLGDKSNGFHVYSFKGARMAFIDEAMRDSKVGVEALKMLTGGASLTGSAKGQDEITFPATHTLVLTSNLPPVVSDAALRRRVRVLPCLGDPVAVRAARGALVGNWWRAEMPGVLAVLMREAAGWLADRASALTERAPLQIQTAVGGLVAEQDLVTQWLEDATVADAQGTKSRALYVAFRGWCRDGGAAERSIPTEAMWGRRLNAAGHPATKRMDANYRPLRLQGTSGLVGWQGQ